jgi:hypothetical protein
MIAVRLTRVRIMAAVAGLAASGVVAGIVVAATPAAAGPASAGTAPAAAARVVLVNQCTGKGQVRPHPNIPLPGCMTGNELIGNGSWTSWGSAAFGAGDLEVNNCTPSSSCGPSKYTKYPILIVLWRARPWQGGGRYFSRMTYIFTSKKPRHSAVTNTVIWPPAAQ